MADLNKASVGGTTYNLKDNFSIWGGENLLYNTQTTNNPTAYLAHVIKLSENMVVGQTYTLQLGGVTLSRSDKTTPGIRPYGGGGMVPLGDNMFPDSKGYCKMTFVAPSSTYTDINNANIHFGNSPGVGASGTTYNMTFTKGKLEKGHKATNWSPCAADMFTMSGTTLVCNL